ncbi:MAG: molybdopterin cofactor-binding domain-containing protein [Sulfitobacter sp.]
MGRVRTIARRTFLIGSAAVAGGVVFGTYMVRKPHENPLQGMVGAGEATFNPWVMISGDTITLITPHTDTRQGVETMQAALIAEELDVDLDQVTTSPGIPAAAYYNRALADEAVPFASTDDGYAATTMRGIMGAAVKLLGAQLTGGSSSVPDSFEKLREAGAVARETIKAAAAQKTGVSVADLRTGKGAVILPDGTSIPYTELAEIAAGIDPVTDVMLRDASEWRVLGKPAGRTDMVAKSTGTATYGIDLRMDGMVHAALKCNPRKGAALNGYDASAARDMRGVQQIVDVTNGVAVIADNTWRAFQALEEIDFDWGAAPYPAEQADHWKAVADSFTDAALDKEWRNDGDVEGALDAGDSVAAEYRAPYVAHQPLEPLSVVVQLGTDRCDVWACHQVPRFVQDRVAAIVGLDSEEIHFHAQFGGGSFGHRLEFDFIDRAAEIAKELPGVPVKLTYRREEDFAQDYPRQIGMSRGQGVVKDGRVEALDLQIATVSSSRSQAGRLGAPVPGPDTQIAAGVWSMPFAIPHTRVRAYAVPELAPTSSWRSVGASTAGFFGESFFDELIVAAGADAMEERLRLVNNDVARKVLEAVAEMSNWGSPLGTGRGRGLAMVNSFGVPCAEVIEVTDTDAGIRIDKVFVAADVGTVLDPVNFENQVQGGVVWALGHAMNAEITISDGMVEQDNFHVHEGMRLHQCPEITVRGLENADKIRGIGEPSVPPAAAALANAIFAATGQRIREMPFDKHVTFV